MHPLVHHGSFDGDAPLLEDYSRALELRLLDGEGEVLGGEARRVLLKDDQARLVSHPQEEPMPVIVAQAGLEAKNVAIEPLRLSQILDADRDLVDPANRKHSS